MIRVFINTLCAVLLMAALSTRCVFGCFAEIESASKRGGAHECCHRGKSQPKPVKVTGCETASFEVQSKTTGVELAMAMDLTMGLLSPPIAIWSDHKDSRLGSSPPGRPPSHQVLLI